MEGSLVAYKVFTNGSVLNASEINDNLMNQSIIVFSNEAARTAAITSPIEGMVTYLEDTAAYESYDGAAWIGFGGGSGILQVVSTIKTDTFTTTSTSFTPLTGLSASITPSSTSSKILVVVSVEGASSGGTTNSIGSFRVIRDSTAIGIGDAAGSRGRATGVISTRDSSALVTHSNTKSILDTPASVSSITYSVEVNVGASTLYINRIQTDTDGTFTPRPVSTLTLMEVAG
jgi:hypothetical protein